MNITPTKPKLLEKKQRKPQPTTLKNKDTIKPKRLVSDYDFAFGFRTRPLPQSFFDNLALRFVETALNDDDILTFEDLLIKEKVGWGTLDDWCKKHEDLKKAKKYAMMIIGNRRERGALLRKMDPSFIARSMPMYSERWKELNEWYAKLKEERESKGTLIVRMDSIPTLEEKKDV